ncbi:MAG: hypothetical protein RR835_14335, partial [Peptostreptococcaceae bacterium]
MGKFNKSIKVFLIMGLVVMGTIGCTSVNEKENKSVKNEEDKFSVGIVLGEGGANDQSFNQSSIEGLEKAK